MEDVQLTVIENIWLAMQMLLYKAADLGVRLSAAFKSNNGILFSNELAVT